MKPYVICHMMSPLDGRLIVADWATATRRSFDELIEVYDNLHDEIGADAWISGRKTGEEFSNGVDGYIGASGIHGERPLHVAKNDAREYAVLIDKDGRLTWRKSDVDGAHVIVLLGCDVSDDHLGHLTKAGISYIVSEDEEINLSRALGTLALEFGIHRLMLEGGAHTNGHFFQAGLVDEVSFILFPAIGGKTGTPSIFEGGDEGLADVGKLELISAEKRELDTVHVRYKVVK